MQESVVKENGHYQIALPWKSRNTKLSNNRVVSEKRLGYLSKRLRKDPLLHQKYWDKMAEYLKSGHACKIPENALVPSLKTWYVPHHATVLRFRSGPLAVMADIKGMFHQIMVAPGDRDSLCFLW